MDSRWLLLLQASHLHLRPEDVARQICRALSGQKLIQSLALLPPPADIHLPNISLNFCIIQLLSRVRLLATPWTAAHQAPPSMGFSRQEYWSGVPLPSPGRCYGNLKNCCFPVQADCGHTETSRMFPEPLIF